MASSTFTLAADPDTDIWKKPPSHDVFTAPYRTLAKRPTRSFVSASLTFSAPYAHQFDQAGLLLIFARPSAPGTPRKWLKAGVELFDGLPRLSTVACDAWSDWSVAPVGGGGASAGGHRDAAAAVAAGTRPVTIRIDARREGPGDVTMWIHHVAPPADAAEPVLVPMRELCWPFGEAAGDGWELEIAAAVARPSKDVEGKLEATFQDFKVEWSDEAP